MATKSKSAKRSKTTADRASKTKNAGASPKTKSAKKPALKTKMPAPKAKSPAPKAKAPAPKAKAPAPRRRHPTKPKAIAAAAAVTPVLVVNMIPKSMSGEQNQDSEPCIAVNPANAQQIAATAFTPDPMGGDMAPIFISQDGGNNWMLNSIVPSEQITGDITISYGSTGSWLYAGILRFPAPAQQTRLNILRTDNSLSADAMSVLVDRTGVDQPYIQAATATRSASAAQAEDRVYVGHNDFGAGNGQTTTIEFSLDGRETTPTFDKVRLEQRPTAGQNGPQSRPTIHPDGVVYAAYYGWRARNGSWPANTLVVTADVVVVRDDNWASGNAPFTVLTDPGDNLPGLRVTQSVTFPFHSTGQGVPGQQRVGGDIAIAVDPTDSQRVYLAWGQNEPATSVYSLHLRRSTDGGASWSSDLLPPLPMAINPSLAVNDQGKVGLLYQQLTGTGAAERWVTHLRRSTDAIHWDDLILATVPASTPSVVPPTGFDPYIGDYDHLMAVGKDFYGVFSAQNTPDKTNFPNGVVFQRNADFTTRTLLDVDNSTAVTVSIDPFFFKVTE